MLGRILVSLGGLVVVVLFGALLAPLFVDWTDFRKDFEEQASRIVGKPVVVHGAVDARLLPFPSVTLHDVRVGQEADGTPLVQVARFSMDAEIAPFLSGEALIFDMRIEEPKARVRLLNDGTLDWMRGTRVTIPAKTVVLENVHVTDGDIEFIDDQSGRTRHITGLNAEMSARSLAGPWRVEGRAAIDGEKGSFTLSSSQPDETRGTMALKTRIQPDERPFGVDLDGELAFSEGRPLYRGNFIANLTDRKRNETKTTDATEPRLKGSFELTNDRVRIPEYRLELGGTDDPYVVTGEATLDNGRQAEFLLLADGQQIDVNRLGPQGSQGKTGRDPGISARQRLNTLIEMAASIPVPQVPGRASLKLPAIVIGDTTIRDVRLDVRPSSDGWKVENAVAILPGRTQIEAKGELQLRDNQRSFTGELLAASSQPSGLSTWLSGAVDPAIRQLKTAGFSAAVSLTPELQRFEGLELVMGDAVLRGRVERQSVGDQKPALSVDLSGNAIDLDAMRGLAEMFSGQDADSGLLDHRIAVQLKAGELTAFGVKADGVETVFTLDAGAMSLERLTIANLAGAAMTAIGRAEGNIDKYAGTGRLTFNAFDPGPFLALLRDRLPRHPAIERLVRNAGWYANTDLKMTLAFGGDEGQGLSVKASGTANGSRIKLDFQIDDFLDLIATGAVRLEATLENPVTSILFGQAGFDPLPFEADENGLLAVKIAANRDTPADASLTYSTNRTSFNAGGKIDLSAERFLQGSMKLQLETADIEPYLMMNGFSIPGIGAGLPIKASSDLVIDKDKIEFATIAAKAGDDDIAGRIALARNAAMAATGELTLNSASVGWLAEAVYGPVTNPETGALADTPVAASAFSGLDLDLKLTAKTFTPEVFGPVEDFSTVLTYKKDQLVLQDMAGRWAGGKLTGRLLMGSAQGGGFLQSRLDVADGDTASLSWLRKGAPVFGGRFALTSSLEATGKSAADMARSASGSGQLQLSQVTINGLNLDVLKPMISAADLMEGDLGTDKIGPVAEVLVDNGSAILGAVTVPFNITEGVARVQNVTAGNELAQLALDASIDLAAQQLEASVDLDFAAGDAAVTGARPGMRLNFAGPLAAPERKVDAADLAGFLSLRAFERERRRVEKLQANVLEKQRLRREVALYSFRIEEREAARLKAAELERLRLEAEQRQRQMLIEQEARARADAAAAAAAEQERAAEEARRALNTNEADQGSLPVSPEEKVIRRPLQPL